MSAASAAVSSTRCTWSSRSVAVVATHQLTNVAASAITDEDGRFRFPYLRIGVYDIKVIAARVQRLHAQS